MAQKNPKKRAAKIDPELLRFSPLLDDEPQKSADATYTIKAKVWLYTGKGAWHFATVPKAQSADIRSRFAAAKRGWGSVRVNVKIGDTEWDTSLFPQGKTGSYLFAIKASVRKAEGIEDGSAITAHLSIQG